LNKPAADIAHLFGVETTQGANYSEEVYPGYPGLVMAGRRLKVMNWGFPLVMTGRNGQKLKPKPVTNARDDKLSTAFWRASFESRRCLIPVSAWAEPEGEAGQMTRTWYSLPGGEPFAVAGLWRATEEWGDAYTMVMVESSPQMREVHDRMPVIFVRITGKHGSKARRGKPLGFAGPGRRNWPLSRPRRGGPGVD
jgi:putative SOS response-associated peptidase YedK